jgi:putative methyltransferase (TIGR04325 family)
MLNKIKQMPLVLPIRKVLYDRKFSTHLNANYFRGVYHSFEEANNSAPRTRPVGYDNPGSAKLYKERLSRIHSTDYPVLFWMEKIKQEVRNVFDFGGHVGVHFYAYPKVLDVRHLHQWTICDVQKVCEEGQAYASENPRSIKLNFVTDVNLCQGYDLFLAIGSLQYVDWQLHEKLKSINDKPKYILFNITPLHPSTKTITLNSIGTSFCPYQIRKESEFLKGLFDIGYEVLDVWSNEEKKCHIAFEAERSLSYYRGGILKLREQ